MKINQQIEAKLMQIFLLLIENDEDYDEFSDDEYY